MDEKLLKKAAVIVRAKRQIESGGKYDAMSQEAKKTGRIEDGYGAYQYMGDTWKSAAGKYLGNPNADIRDKRNQDRVEMLKTIDQLKQGYTVPEIFGEHNTGSRKGWENKVGVNKWGVKYDAPAYVRKGAAETLRQAQLISGRKVGTGSTSTSEGSTMQEQLVETPEKKESFLGGALKGIVRSVANPLVRTGQLIKKGIASATGNEELKQRVDEDIYGGRKYFGVDFKGVKNVGEGGVKQSLGEGLDFASNIPMAGAGAIATQGIKAGGKQILKNIATPLVKEAVVSGAMAGAGSALQDKGNVKQILGRTLGGAVVGGVTGKLGEKVASKFLTKTTGGQPKVVNEVVDKLKQYSGQGKNLKKNIAKFEKSDAYSTLVKNYMDGIKVADNKITADLGVRNVIDDISTLNNEITTRIKNEPSLFSEVSLISKLRNTIDNSGLVGTSRLKEKNYFTKEIQNILKDYGVSGGKVSAESIHKLRQYLDGVASDTFKINNGVVTPKEQAARAMADELRNIMRSSIKDKSIGDMLKAESKLLATKDLMETLNGRVVKGGRLGRYFAGATGAGIGALAGAPLGGVGAVMGGYIGKEAAEKLQSIVANGAIGTMIQRYKLDKISKNAISALLDAGKIDEAVAEALMKVAPTMRTPYDNAVVKVVTSPTFKKITANAIMRQAYK